MLFGQDLRGRHQRGLPARFDGQEHRGEGDKGLAGSDIALKKAIHAARCGKIAADFGNNFEPASPSASTEEIAAICQTGDRSRLLRCPEAFASRSAARE